jgi:hypothetical protein
VGLAADGVKCEGRYCDDMALSCTTLPPGVGLQAPVTQPSFSEEGQSSQLLQTTCYTGPPDQPPIGGGINGGCEAIRPYAKNVRLCFGGYQIGAGTGGKGVITHLKCEGSYCDRITLTCAKLTKGRLRECEWTDWISEEDANKGWNQIRLDGKVATGMECAGSNCDQVRIYACQIFPDEVETEL